MANENATIVKKKVLGHCGVPQLNVILTDQKKYFCTIFKLMLEGLRYC